jgi:transcriptional regulator with XRE-family HTH domain
LGQLTVGVLLAFSLAIKTSYAVGEQPAPESQAACLLKRMIEDPIPPEDLDLLFTNPANMRVLDTPLKQTETLSAPHRQDLFDGGHKMADCDEFSLKNLQENIRNFLNNSGVPLAQLADKAHLSSFTIYQILNGAGTTPTITTLKSLANAMKISTLKLLEHEESQCPFSLQKPFDGKGKKAHRFDRGLDLLPQKIRQYLKSQDLSVAALARKANLTYMTLHQLLKGAVKNPKINTLKSLAKAMGIKMKKLLKGKIKSPAPTLESPHL